MLNLCKKFITNNNFILFARIISFILILYVLGEFCYLQNFLPSNSPVEEIESLYGFWMLHLFLAFDSVLLNIILSTLVSKNKFLLKFNVISSKIIFLFMFALSVFRFINIRNFEIDINSITSVSLFAVFFFSFELLLIAYVLDFILTLIRKEQVLNNKYLSNSFDRFIPKIILAGMIIYFCLDIINVNTHYKYLHILFWGIFFGHIVSIYILNIILAKFNNSNKTQKISGENL